MGILSSLEDIFASQKWYKSTITSSILLLYGLSLLLVVESALPVFGVIKDPTPNKPDKDGICNKGVDIRTALAAFKGLKGCRVIEGFVQILLFDSIAEEEFSNLTFPELTEITDYLLLYRVNGLRTIGQLFPNLAVIRGQNLFYNYALIIFEMPSLQEISLYSLTNITRGLIRIDKNPSLCFVNSIDWDQIASEKGEHFIKNSKPENECPLCAEEETIVDEQTGLVVHNKCPKVHKTAFDDITTERYLCWNRKRCQRKCPSNCHACNLRGECCSPKCIGGCAIDNIENCTVCKNFTVGINGNQTCWDHCPDDGSYEYLGRRCVSSEVCQKTKMPMDVRTSEEEYYKIFEKSCVLECPTNYMSNENGVCVKCNGRCQKKCPGLNVDSITLAKQLRGCTHIDGDLEIQIRGGRNIANELEESLSMIEEISGYLKIVRSFPLVSLSFFKSLRRLGGEHLETQKYVFVVLDNQNLQDLWDWTNRTFEIGKGRLFFHFNPKLCLDKIDKLAEVVGMFNRTDLEVSKNSNGDKVACQIDDLPVQVSIHDDAVQLTWDQYQLEDQRKLLGYIVYSIEAPYTNVTLYDGKDACGGDGWRVDDVAVVDDKTTKVVYLLARLKPYTQYAFYVKTYTIATERRGKKSRGARSNIMYFRTSPSTPSPPQNLQVTSVSSHEFEITWQRPLYLNGNVTFYIVSGKKHVELFMDDERDFCENLPEINLPSTPITMANITNTSDTCHCEDEQKQAKIRINEVEQQSRIDFENTLHNEVYRKRDPSLNRKRRQVDIKAFPNMTHIAQRQMYSPSPEIQNKTDNETGLWESFSFTSNTTKFFINKLHHYTYYDISVRACREIEKEELQNGASTIRLNKRCSAKAIKREHTRVKEDADNISHIALKNQTTDSVTITWDEPQKPNGIIYAYDIEFRSYDIENSRANLGTNLICITRKAFLEQNKLYTINLRPGNYSVRVRALTSARNRRYTPKFSPSLVIIIKAQQRLQVILSVIFSILFMCMAVFGGLYYRKNQRDKKNMRLISTVNPEYVHTVYEPDDWEIPRDNICYQIEDALGQGSFGMVYEGIAHDIRGQTQVKCAIKTVNEHATDRERIEFLNEASVMKAFDTSHVVRLLGVVSKGQPTLVIMELMANGDLKSYLRSHRPDAENPSPRQPPTLRQILQMAIEIADGMAYLAAKKFVHRDLAARNCMVSEDLTVKIGDFGMTRDIYETDYYRKGTKGLLPVRWMAPESLQDGVFTSSSDVWSYGVVLWEMATLGSQPYQGLSNDQVLRYVIAGGLMERPENCPDILYNLMTWCWQHKPSHRPSFVKLCSQLVDDANPTFAQVSFYHSSAGIEAQHSRPTPSPSQDDANTPLRADLEERSSFSNTDDDSDVDIRITPHNNRHRKFKGKVIGNTANGFVGCPTNGAATTQC